MSLAQQPEKVREAQAEAALVSGHGPFRLKRWAHGPMGYDTWSRKDPVWVCECCLSWFSISRDEQSGVLRVKAHRQHRKAGWRGNPGTPGPYFDGTLVPKAIHERNGRDG